MKPSTTFYGKSIGKNLKPGNEIENSHRIARIILLSRKIDFYAKPGKNHGYHCDHAAILDIFLRYN